MEIQGSSSPQTGSEDAFLGLSSLGLKPDFSGKVREILDLGDQLLLVATDRISAFDHVMPNPIPGRGRVLGRIAAFWFRGLEEIIPTHFVTNDATEFPGELKDHATALSGRAMLVKKAQRIDIECIVRGYLAGSGYGIYRETGEINGVQLPEGLKEYERLPEPIFTPTTKAEEGHDESISYEEMASQVGSELAAALKRASLEIYSRGAAYAQKRGIVIADTKFEFGILNDKLVVIDEVLTPDSSRFWPAESVELGKKPVSLDKQFLRDYLLSTDWDRNSPPPEIPNDIITRTSERYQLAERLLVSGAARPSW